MNKPSFIYRLLQTLGLVLLSLTIAMTLLGGAGTTCVAFKAENWESMASLIPVKPVLQILVIVSIVAGIAGIFTAVRLPKGRKHAYYAVILFLVIAGAASAIQFYFSATLRGKTAPNNMRLYLTGITLLYFLLMRLPGIWQKLPFNRSSPHQGSMVGSGLSFFTSGLLTLTATLWSAPTHTLDGVNTANELLIPLLLMGSILIILGTGFLRFSRQDQQIRPQASQHPL